MNRQKIELTIITKVVDDTLAAGFTLSVWEGEDWAIKRSTDREAILASMQSTDSDTILFYIDDTKYGWVELIYGNGCDVISDYSMNMEQYLIYAKQTFRGVEQLTKFNFYIEALVTTSGQIEIEANTFKDAVAKLQALDESVIAENMSDELGTKLHNTRTFGCDADNGVEVVELDAYIPLLVANLHVVMP